MAKLPTYVLDKPLIIEINKFDTLTLARGTFIKPVSAKYLPKHILDDPKFLGFNENEEAFCYTRYGFILIPRKLIRELD